MGRRRWTIHIVSHAPRTTRSFTVSEPQLRGALAGLAVAALAALASLGLVVGPREAPAAALATLSPADSAELARLRVRLLALEDTLGALKPRAGGRPAARPESRAAAAKAASVAAMKSAPTPGVARAGADVPRAAAPAATPRPFAGRLGLSPSDDNVRALVPFGGTLTSGFATGRAHPLLGRTRPHRGVDVAAPYGAPIVAPAPGIVSRVARELEFGLVVEIDHGAGVVTKYAHLSRALVREGQRVAPGDRVALVGRSGLASGTHLHYEVHVRGESVDPLGVTLPGTEPDTLPEP